MGALVSLCQTLQSALAQRITTHSGRTQAFAEGAAARASNTAPRASFNSFIMHQCRSLAEQTAPLDYAGVVGPDQTTSWFARRAAELGVKFLTPIPERIHRLTGKPKYPGCPGYPRRVTADDANLLADWIAGFMREATPRDPVRDDCVPGLRGLELTNVVLKKPLKCWANSHWIPEYSWTRDFLRSSCQPTAMQPRLGALSRELCI